MKWHITFKRWSYGAVEVETLGLAHSALYLSESESAADDLAMEAYKTGQVTWGEIQVEIDAIDVVKEEKP